jgi:hypothetical protein
VKSFKSDIFLRKKQYIKMELSIPYLKVAVYIIHGTLAPCVG